MISRSRTGTPVFGLGMAKKDRVIADPYLYTFDALMLACG